MCLSPDTRRCMNLGHRGHKRVIGIIVAILASLHMNTAEDLFGTAQGSPRTDKLIAASIQWAKKIMEKIDSGDGG